MDQGPWVPALDARRQGRDLSRRVPRGANPVPRGMRRAAWFLALEACPQPRPKVRAYRAPAFACWSVVRGPWSVDLGRPNETTNDFFRASIKQGARSGRRGAF